MKFLIVSLAFLGITSGAVLYSNNPASYSHGYANQPTAYASQPTVYAAGPVVLPATPVTPELAAAADKMKCNLKALSESACRLAESITCKLKLKKINS